MNAITIAGGGLAGLSLGIALRRADVPVTVVEARTYPRHRVCGEFVCGVSHETLRSLGILDDFADALRHDVSAWFVGDAHLGTRALPRVALALSRHRLDAALSRRFAALGGELRTSERAGTDPRPGLVVATGRPPVRDSRWLGLKVHVTELSTEAGLEMHIGTDGYVGLCRVEDGRVNVCGLFRRPASLHGHGLALLMSCLEANGLRALARRLRDAQPDDESFCVNAGFGLGRTSVAPDELRLGDAYALIPPLTGNGMSLAFEMAALAREPLVAYARGARTWSAVLAEVNALVRRGTERRMRWSTALHPLLFTRSGRWLFARTFRLGTRPFDFLFRRLRAP